MNEPSRTDYRLDDRLARLLNAGTWASCVLIAAGWAIALAPSSRALVERLHLASIGIVLLIVLPVVRVAVMGLWFWIHRERRFALFAALVLAIIGLSTALGAWLR